MATKIERDRKKEADLHKKLDEILKGVNQLLSKGPSKSAPKGSKK